MFDIILKELKEDYPGQRTLTLKQCGEMIGRSRGAMYKLRKRGRLDIPYKKIGGEYVVSIHAFAKYLAELEEPDEVEEGKEVKKPKAAKPKTTGKTSISTITGKEIVRNRAPLSKTLWNTFTVAIEKMRDDLEFHEALYRELERIDLNLSVPDSKPRRKSPL